ncbi:tyrosine-type recombinase/integrase [Streptomyces sp900105245]|uniref:site-specific integrase n=1 Tax=Streptomyces sp. 900105245 TaxID=3154379 RepID=UPI003319A61F
MPQPDGTRKRKTVYGSTWEECDEKRQELVRRDRQGIPTPSRSAKLSEWLPYWLEEYIRPNRKRTTYVKYEMHVRLYLVPLLGSRRLESLTTTNVRHMISKVTAQSSAATAKEAHRVLRTAITAACRDELISRNVVQLVPAPRVEPRELRPWSIDETLTFLEAARTDRLYTAFVLAIALGLRRGEILGLQWRDVDLDRRTLTVRTTLNRGGNALYLDTTKNRRSRVIPIPRMCVAPLRWHRMQQAERRAAAGVDWHTSDHVFTTRSGRPIEPRTSTARSSGFRNPRTCRRCASTTHGMAARPCSSRPASRPGPSWRSSVTRIAVTMNVYTHVSDDHRREAMSHMDRLLKRRR